MDLSRNDFGSGSLKNIKYLIEGLAKNHTLTTLILSKNGFGSGNIQNMKLFTEGLLIIQSLSNIKKWFWPRKC